MTHNDAIVNTPIVSPRRAPAVIWQGGALVWLPAVVFLAPRAAPRQGGARVTLIAPQQGRITVARATP
jgi:hypothetical protein